MRKGGRMSSRSHGALNSGTILPLRHHYRVTAFDLRGHGHRVARALHHVEVRGVRALDVGVLAHAARLLRLEREVRRVEAKYSRYRDDSVTAAINRSNCFTN